MEVTDDDNNESLRHQIRLTCLDWKLWFYVLIFMGTLIPLYSLNIFLPIIMNDIFPTNDIAKLLAVPPYIASCIATIISSWNAARLNERSGHIMILIVIQICGFLYLIIDRNRIYISAIIIGLGVFSTNTLILSWITNNITGRTKRALFIALVISLGNVGAILSERMYHKSNKERFNEKHWTVIGILCFTFILVLLLKLLLRYENRRIRTLYEHIEEETTDGNGQPQLNQVDSEHKSPFSIIIFFFSRVLLFM